MKRLWILTALLSGFSLHTSSAEDIEPWDPVPIPAPVFERIEPEITKNQPFEGVKNKPPFELAVAQQCETQLIKRRISYKVEEQILDERGCVVERPLSVNGLNSLSLSNEMTLRCEVVLALDDWVKNIVQPSAQFYFGEDLKSLQTSTSYQCRTRNNKPDSKISEHGFANGLDITGFVLADGAVINVSSDEDNLSQETLSKAKFLAGVRAGACAYFTTVLGPDADDTHQDHFHFDLAFRSSGYGLCQ